MATSKEHPAYQNNPFYVATDGLTLLFKMAQSVAIFFVVISALGFAGGFAPTPMPYDDGSSDQSFSLRENETAQEAVARGLGQIPAEAWAIIAVIGTVILLGITFISVVIAGINDYTAAHLAKGKQVSLGEAFKGVMNRFFSYLWLQVLVFLKLVGWTLLLIVPGIIMATRYTLAGTAFFGENLGANAATKRSAHLTKGAWFTTFGAYGLFKMITLGLIQPLLQPGTSAVLFRQYAAYDAAKLQKPNAHFLSWLAFFLPIVLIFLLVLLVLVLISASVNFS